MKNCFDNPEEMVNLKKRLTGEKWSGRTWPRRDWRGGGVERDGVQEGEQLLRCKWSEREGDRTGKRQLILGWMERPNILLSSLMSYQHHRPGRKWSWCVCSSGESLQNYQYAQGILNNNNNMKLFLKIVPGSENLLKRMTIIGVILSFYAMAKDCLKDVTSRSCIIITHVWPQHCV